LQFFQQFGKAFKKDRGQRLIVRPFGGTIIQAKFTGAATFAGECQSKTG
jgi:hypothetical protein